MLPCGCMADDCFRGSAWTIEPHRPILDLTPPRILLSTHGAPGWSSPSAFGNFNPKPDLRCDATRVSLFFPVRPHPRRTPPIPVLSPLRSAKQLIMEALAMKPRLQSERRRCFCPEFIGGAVRPMVLGCSALFMAKPFPHGHYYKISNSCGWRFGLFIIAAIFFFSRG